MITPQSRTVSTLAVSGDERRARPDSVATEEPLEIQLQIESGEPVSVAITMRTPGSDAELAAGFLWSEQIITDPSQILSVREAGPIQSGGFRNIVQVTVRGDALPDLSDAARRFYMTSSCGICGKASLEAIESRQPFVLTPAQPHLHPETIYALPDILRAAQETFERTGGLHAAGLFDASGKLLSLHEDVGRHNAVDKLIGAAVLAQTLPLSESVLLVTGRASFELVQKAVMAGIPVLAAVGAPSSLAVALANDAGLTLLGFLRGQRFNIYAGDERIT